MQYDGRTFRQALEELQHWTEAQDDWNVGMEADTPTVNTGTAQMSNTETATTQRRRSEAATSTEVSTTENSQDYVQSLQKKGKDLEDLIARERNKMLKMLQNVWDSNDNFIAQYNDMSQTYKLLDEITVINWSYGHDMEQYLHSRVVKFRAVLTNNTNYLNSWQKIPEDALIKKDKTGMMRGVIGELGGPSSVDNMAEYIGHMRAQFRGRKSEKNYRGDMANKIMQEIRRFASTKSSFQQDIQAVDRIVKSATSSAMTQSRNTNFSDEDRRSIAKLFQSFSYLVRLYLEVMSFVYRLEIEYILNRRAIVTRLYEK